MSMVSQGFPLWAVESDGTAYAVVGWSVRESITYPYLVPLDPAHVRGAVVPDDSQVFTYTTTDPSERPDASPEPGKPAAEWSEGDIRVALRHIADRLDVLGATAPARRIREILESPAEPAPDDLRERLHELADTLAKSSHEPVRAVAKLIHHEASQ